MATEVILYTGRNQLQENQAVQPHRFTWEVTESPANTWTWTFTLYDIQRNICPFSILTFFVSNTDGGGVETTGLSSISGATNGKILYEIATGVTVHRTDSDGELDVEVILSSGTKYLNIVFPNGHVETLSQTMAYS